MYRKLLEISKKPVSIKYVFLLLVLLFIAIRFIHLPETIVFGSDEGRDFLTIYNIYIHKQPTLIGPPSEYTISGRQFFFGPAPYYVILPALILGNWNPIAVSYFLVFLNAIVLVMTLFILNKYIKQRIILYAFATLSTVTPLFVQYTRSYWNPYFMFPISILLIGLLVANKYKNKLWHLALIGFLLGLGMQFHFSFIFAILVTIMWLLKNKSLTLKNCFVLSVGFIVGVSPLILFDLRNHFYNIQTFLLVLQSGGIHNRFSFNTFYFISLFPFIIFFLSLLLGAIHKRVNYVIPVLLITYTCICLWFITKMPVSILNLPVLQNIANSIEKDNPTNFNIVDQFTTDNRALALRYILTVQGYIPLSITNYTDAESLYIYSNKPLSKLINNPVYEIKSFLPYKTEKTLDGGNSIFIYKLGK